jgi:hypothetical protein
MEPAKIPVPFATTSRSSSLTLLKLVIPSRKFPVRHRVASPVKSPVRHRAAYPVEPSTVPSATKHATQSSVAANRLIAPTRDANYAVYAWTSTYVWPSRAQLPTGKCEDSASSDLVYLSPSSNGDALQTEVTCQSFVQGEQGLFCCLISATVLH